MESKVSLLKEVQDGGYEASLITTFNAYLPFYEEVVLRKLVSNGVRHNVLMMDQFQCQQSFAHQPPSFAGRRYSLLPMRSKGAFHPKIILLVGKRKGLLAIGSHNLTLAGFGNNRELTNLIRFRVDAVDDSASVITQVWRYLEGWMRLQGDRLPLHLHEMVGRIVSFAPWLSDTESAPGDISVIATLPDGPSLWNQLKSKIEGPVRRVILGGAFFDRQLAFLDRLRVDLDPCELIVGIAPSTVKAPPKLANMDGVRVVNASQIKPVATDDDLSMHYLHAKSLVIEMEGGEYHLVTGSANPSAPAWLASAETGNTEMMVVRSDSKVYETVEMLGLMAVADAPKIKASEWEELTENWEREDPECGHSMGIGIAVATENRIQFNTQKTISAPLCCELLDGDGAILQSIYFYLDQSVFKLQPEADILSIVASINVRSKEQVEAQFFVHHEVLISEQSRTGTQRKFREALSSLSFSSPDLETFLTCVDRIIFAKAEEVNKAPKIQKVRAHQDDHSEPEEGVGFAVDLSETKKIKRKHRLQAKEDLAYLLDVLIYHLNVDNGAVNTYDSVDKMGRNEEEQVGAEDSDEERLNNVEVDSGDNKKILDLCHKKVRSLVNRMVENLEGFRNQKLAFESIVVKLTSVLAVLRELRNCDGTQSWVDQGQTTVPLEFRKGLLRAVLEGMFEGRESLLQAEVHSPEASGAEDVVHLKGLIVWLAWDCGLRFCAEKPFSETAEAEEERLISNAWLLAITQLISNDDTIIGQAKESIGPLCGGDLEWLKWAVGLSERLENIKEIIGDLPYSDQASPGDIGIHANLMHLGFRLIHKKIDRDKVGMIRFDSAKPLITYKSDTIKYFPCSQVVLAE